MNIMVNVIVKNVKIIKFMMVFIAVILLSNVNYIRLHAIALVIIIYILIMVPFIKPVTILRIVLFIQIQNV